MMRHLWNRGLSAMLSLAVVSWTAFPSWAAEEGETPFAQVSVLAGETDFPQQPLGLALYQESGAQGFLQVNELELSTAVNQVTKDVIFYLVPLDGAVTVRIDYLTDLNQDGRYELLHREDSPAGDQITSTGEVVTASSGEADHLMAGQTYAIQGQQLLQRGRIAIQERLTQGSSSYLPELAGGQGLEDGIIYLITLSHQTQEGVKREQCYYLRLYDQLPPPSVIEYQDVSQGAWYYHSVDYVLGRRLMEGISRSEFAPEEPLSRGSLAQTLYRLGGNQEKHQVSLADVPPASPQYDAIAWAVAHQMMDPIHQGIFGPGREVTREELARVLYAFAQYSYLDTGMKGDLSGFTDAAQIPVQAQEALSWAVARGILEGRGGQEARLDPTALLSRGEFAAVIRLLCENILPERDVQDRVQWPDPEEEAESSPQEGGLLT